MNKVETIKAAFMKADEVALEQVSILRDCCNLCNRDKRCGFAEQVCLSVIKWRKVSEKQAAVLAKALLSFPNWLSLTTERFVSENGLNVEAEQPVQLSLF